MRKDIMVDIETLGTTKGSSIFQIAAMSFDITTGKVFDEFNMVADISNYELNVDGSTLKWWLNTDKELLSKLLNNPNCVSEGVMVNSFKMWIESSLTEDTQVYLWGNGILFDNVKLQDVMTKYGLKYPIFYRNDRDLRTLLELASLKSGKNENELKDLVTNEDEVKHDAYDDIKFQIRLAHECYKIIMSNEYANDTNVVICVTDIDRQETKYIRENDDKSRYEYEDFGWATIYTSKAQVRKVINELKESYDDVSYSIYPQEV